MRIIKLTEHQHQSLLRIVNALVDASDEIDTWVDIRDAMLEYEQSPIQNTPAWTEYRQVPSRTMLLDRIERLDRALEDTARGFNTRLIHSEDTERAFERRLSTLESRWAAYEADGGRGAR